jgi:ABC-2 type transport system permease protein
VKIFLAIVRLNLKIMIQYRTTFMLSIVGEPILFLINTIFFSALYAYNDKSTVVGYSLSQMIWYFASISIVWQCIWNATDNNVSQKILTGDLAVDLLKPVSTFKFELARALAGRILALVLESLPVLLLFSLLSFPRFVTASSVLRFLIIMPLSFFLFFLLNYNIGLTAFYITNNQSLQRLRQVLITLTAGGLIPLAFFPEWLRRIAELLPFQYLFHWPIQFFLNGDPSLGWAAFVRVVLMESLWIGFFLVVSRFFWKRAAHKYCTAGG